MMAGAYSKTRKTRIMLTWGNMLISRKNLKPVIHYEFLILTNTHTHEFYADIHTDIENKMNCLEKLITFIFRNNH